MKVGSIVECISNSFWDYDAHPAIGEQYTVAEIGKASNTDTIVLRVEEMSFGANRHTGEEYGYHAKHFRELLPPADISEIYKDALTIPERGLILVKETINTPTYEEAI